MEIWKTKIRFISSLPAGGSLKDVPYYLYLKLFLLLVSATDFVDSSIVSCLKCDYESKCVDKLNHAF